eukprot:TRINITY_DN17908_c0_g1_i1.p1 TRINITY_DN17908_c0_g1~~TRINITY_DN17908_c0_g1_i1.p1  ORF type:complete len:127 (+),score=41.74 TRINITY_DN17908_c0_g1_i1:118-498(+)
MTNKGKDKVSSNESSTEVVSGDANNNADMSSEEAREIVSNVEKQFKEMFGEDSVKFEFFDHMVPMEFPVYSEQEMKEMKMEKAKKAKVEVAQRFSRIYTVADLAAYPDWAPVDGSGNKLENEFSKF